MPVALAIASLSSAAACGAPRLEWQSRRVL
jgi:hypothetical protein